MRSYYYYVRALICCIKPVVCVYVCLCAHLFVHVYVCACVHACVRVCIHYSRPRPVNRSTSSCHQAMPTVANKKRTRGVQPQRSNSETVFEVRDVYTTYITWSGRLWVTWHLCGQNSHEAMGSLCYGSLFACSSALYFLWSPEWLGKSVMILTYWRIMSALYYYVYYIVLL